MLKQKRDMLGILGAIGFVAILLIFGAYTNGFINSVSAQQQFTANLSGSKGVPPINTPATGVTKFTLSADGKSLNYVLNVTNIHSVIGAHIHSGNGQQNGPVALILFGNPTMTGPPTGTVNGVLSKGNSTTLDLKGPLAGKQLSDLVSLIKSGNAYVNVHTTQNPKGEIRGQITTGS
ncbi:MAG: CHRD domain-containing protein [Candidatus Nitrosopolaris sp.]